MSPNPKNKSIKQSSIICFLTIRDQYTDKPKVKHCPKDELLQSIYGLAIGKYENEDHVYLFYCGRNWETLTYSLHPSVDDAKTQAEQKLTNTINLWEGH